MNTSGIRLNAAHASSTAHDATASHNDGSLINGPLWVASTAPLSCGGGGGGGGAAASEVSDVLQPPSLSIVKVDSACQLTITGAPGGTCVIQVSSDLKHWKELSNVFNESGSFQFDDTMATGVTARFYRVIQNP